MVNTNKYQIKMMPSCIITITKEDESFSSYALIHNQLVSILYINPKNGDAEVVRGRVKEFEYKPVARDINRSASFQSKNNMDGTNPISHIVLDVSKNFNSQSINIDPTTILEVHPIEWNYQDINKAEIDANASDWYEESNEVSAPSAEFQFRMEGR